MDNWRQVTDSGTTPIRRKYQAQVSMGLGRGEQHPEHSGERTPQFISENNQRNYYKRWHEFMNAESWKDIHIDPITANYEGTATFKG